MDIQEIKDLMALLEGSKLGKIVLKRGDVELHLEKEASQAAPAVRQIVPPSYLPEAPHAPVEAATPKKEEALGSFVTSPMVGTYYASPSPDQPWFVKVGDQVSEGTVVCIIEAMKVMNEVKAGVKGVVAELLVHNGKPVEFGTRLLRVVEA